MRPKAEVGCKRKCSVVHLLQCHERENAEVWETLFMQLDTVKTSSIDICEYTTITCLRMYTARLREVQQVRNMQVYVPCEHKKNAFY